MKKLTRMGGLVAVLLFGLSAGCSSTKGCSSGNCSSGGCSSCGTTAKAEAHDAGTPYSGKTIQDVPLTH
jgi:hypothetical protein